jgi:hypothetical protein
MYSGRQHWGALGQGGGAAGPPGSESTACKQGIYRNLGDLAFSPTKINAEGQAYQKWPRPAVNASRDWPERT